MKQVELTIFDLDNTLYDWYGAFIPAFYAMVDVAVDLLCCDRDMLLDELKAVHVKHHDVEHPFSLMETGIAKTLIAEEGQQKVRAKLDPAFHAFNKVRKRELNLFPGVLETLQALSARNIKLVAFTDSKYFAAIGRIEKLGLTHLFHRIYCRKRGISEAAATRPDTFAELADKITQLPPRETKPNPLVLIDIASREETNVNQVAYVGDSIAKDVLMAKRAGCFAIWAKFGAKRDLELYEKLIRISHWTSDEIAREAQYAQEARAIDPDFVCESSVCELLTILTGRHVGTLRAG